MIPASEGCVVDPWIATPAALFAMPIIECGHASVAPSAEDIEIIVHGPAILARLILVPLNLPAMIVAGIGWTAESLVH